VADDGDVGVQCSLVPPPGSSLRVISAHHVGGLPDALPWAFILARSGATSSSHSTSPVKRALTVPKRLTRAAELLSGNSDLDRLHARRALAHFVRVSQIFVDRCPWALMGRRLAGAWWLLV